MSLGETSPRLFSFNNPYGACESCGGLGVQIRFDPDLVVPNPGLSLRRGAIAPWAHRNSIFYFQMIDALAKHYNFDIDTAFGELPQKIQNVILYGSGDEEIDFYYERDGRRHFFRKTYEGALPNLDRKYHESEKDDFDEELGRYMSTVPCPTCNGARLKKGAARADRGHADPYLDCFFGSQCLGVYREPHAGRPKNGDRPPGTQRDTRSSWLP